jgi:uncharacterized membrane protein
MSYQFAGNQAPYNSTSSFGLSANVAALIAYLFVPVTSIVLLVTEKENRLVRFHAFQSLFFGLGLFALTVVLSVVIGLVSFVLSAISPVAGFLVTMVSLVLWLILAAAILGVWFFCIFKAYKGEMYKLPVFGKFAENASAK